MSTLNSPRLPGVPILQSDATGAEYSRWRRGVKFACETKGTWGFCDGSHSMPMPKGTKPPPSSVSDTTLQPSLLDEQRAWAQQDREVTRDIFLSLSEEVAQTVLHASQPLPPPSMNVQKMMAALDQHFTAFKFEDYHHAFCHFLNLHMDQYDNLEDFNFDFQTTLEDLRDYGHPLSNTQACSAYFSKLRCTQNSWVAKKLEEWDTQSSSPVLQDLMKEPIPWTFKPSAVKSLPEREVESIPEALVEDNSSQSDTDGSNLSARSSPNLHSRQTSNTTAITAHSLEITIHASSEDIAQITAFPRLPATTYIPAASCQVSLKKSMPLMAPLPPANRPLPPLPKHILHSSPRARSASPRIMVPSPNVKISSPKGSAKSTAQTPSLKLETTHPTLRPRSPTLLDQKEYGTKPAPSPITPSETKLHPALRHVPAPTATTTATTVRVTPLSSQPFGPEPTVAVPWPCTPDRPNSSRTDFPGPLQRELPALDAMSRLRAMSGASSTISLPLLGNRAVSPPRLQDRPLLTSAASPPLGSASPPKIMQARTPTGESLGVPSRTPTFESLGVPHCGSPERCEAGKIERSRSPVRELVARLSGDNLEVKEEKDLRRSRKKSWSMGVGLGRFGPGKGIKEIV